MKRTVLHLLLQLLPLPWCLQGHQVMLVAAALFGQSFLRHLALVLSSLGQVLQQLGLLTLGGDKPAE